MQPSDFAHISVWLALVVGTLAPPAVAAEPGALRAGAARVDITPAPDAALPMSGYGSRKDGFQGIHDNIFVRAIVIDDGNTQCAIVAWELLHVPNSVWATVTQRIANELGIRPENVLVAAVHNHGAPSLAGGLGEASAATKAYTAKVEDAAIDAVRRAKAKLQPARVGAGSGQAFVNVNRVEQTVEGEWVLGHNENGPSDKTVAVLRFEDLSGKPIAFLINYAVHAVVMGPRNYQITGDLAGATSRFVEQHYLGKDTPRSDGGPRLALRPMEKGEGDGAVALWTSGAAGDQNPVAMESGNDFSLVNSLARILGEAAVRVAEGIRTAPEARIRSAQKTVTCPGRRLDPNSGATKEYKFADADPVQLRLTLVSINDVALAGVSGEVFTAIQQHLKQVSPVAQTIMVTHANGARGYIPSDAGFERNSYETTVTHLKPGCAENAIVNGLVGMMAQP
jgi:hypothetical protein